MIPPILLSDGIQNALHVARALAREYRNEQYSAAHLLRALLQHDSPGAALLASLGKDVAYLRDWAEVRIEELPRTAFSPSEISADDTVNRVLEEANYTRIRLGLDQVHPICALAALTKPNVGFPPEQLRSFPLQERDLLANFLKEPAGATGAGWSGPRSGHQAACRYQARQHPAQILPRPDSHGPGRPL